MDEIRLFVRDYCSARPEKYPYFDLRKQEGLMRTLMLRTTSTGEIMVGSRLLPRGRSCAHRTTHCSTGAFSSDHSPTLRHQW